MAGTTKGQYVTLRSGVKPSACRPDEQCDFGNIFTVGVWVYGCSFLINGPLTDRYGGKLAILLGAGGSAVANLLMGLCAWSLLNQGPMADTIAENFVPIYSVLYGLNMYFQSFGAVAIVKCNAPWFHVREQEAIGAIFGVDFVGHLFRVRYRIHDRGGRWCC